MLELSQHVTTVTVPVTVNVIRVMKGMEPLLGQDVVVSLEGSWFKS